MNFNLVSTLLAVSSAHDTVHIFKLGNRDIIPSNASITSGTSLSSPPESVDGTASPGLDGGYEAFIEKKKTGGVGCVRPPQTCITL